MSSLRIRNPRAVVDRKKLTVAVNDLVGELGPASPRLRGGLRDLLAAALAAGRAQVRERLESGASGVAAARAHCYLMDQILRVLFDVVVEHLYPVVNPTKAERLSLVAVGGFGRGELAPHSDIDLLFLLPYKATPWSEQVVEFILYMLWDLGLTVGQATRTPEACVRYAKRDLTIRTALLEARYVWGDRDLFTDFRRRFRRDVVAGTEPDFVESKLRERDARHKKFGESRYLVEPNIKEGKGGLRDLHTLYWIAKYIYPIARISDLVDLDVLNKTELRTFTKAEDFLWRVRGHLHNLTDRAEERLTFDVQPELAQLLGYEDRDGSRSVERFMKHYFLVAKSVGSLTRIFCAFLEEKHKRRSRRWIPRFGRRHREVGGFRVEGDRLMATADDEFRVHPIRMIELFHLAQKHDYDIHPRTLRLITRNLQHIGRELQEDVQANRLFMDILTSEKAPDVTLRRMNEAGVLGRFLPDFGRIVAQMQHDMYHVYTVDEHAIQAIGLLARIENGSLKDDHPLSHEVIQKVLSREVLYVATFLHDIAKGRKGDHSEIGAAVAMNLGPRLGLSEGETETVAWLVRHHLYMSGYAFKRDIDDPRTVQDFAEIVQSPERLRLLLILTVADIRAVGPAVWNGWKGQLLRELYYRTDEVITGGQAIPGAAARAADAVRILRERLPDWDEAAFAAYVERHFDTYFLTADPATHVYHAELVRQADAEEEPLTLATRVDPFRAVTEVTLYAADHPGLFARVAGAMALCGANIVDAKIFTTTDGMALDTFWIQDVGHRAFDEPRKLARLKTTVERTLKGSLRPREELSRRPGYPTRASVFRVAPRVLVDNNASDSHTLIEINGRDRPGLLSDITYALFRLNLTISSASITTYGERAVDVFYVRDLVGHKITQEPRLATIERRLLEALEGRAGKAAAEAGEHRDSPPTSAAV